MANELSKYEYECFTEWRGRDYKTTTIIYDKSIYGTATFEQFLASSLSFWSNPAIVFCEQVDGIEKSSEASAKIAELNAEVVVPTEEAEW